MKYAHLLGADNKVTQISMLDDTDTAQDCVDAYGVQAIVCDTPAGIDYTYDAQTKTFAPPPVVLVVQIPAATLGSFGGSTLT